MLDDPALRSLAFVFLGVAALFVLAGLATAVVAPFWAYRYVTAPERQAPHLLPRWLWETAKVELLAAVFVGPTAAIAALLLSRDTALRHTIGIANLVLSLLLAVAIPVCEYRETIYQQTRGHQAARQWLVGAAKGELLTLYVATLAALLLWPEAPWLYVVLMLLFFVSTREYIVEFASLIREAFVGSFRYEYEQYVARHGRLSQTELRMQMRMHGGQLDTDTTAGEGGNDTL